MARDYRLSLLDIRGAAEKVLRYTRGLTFEQFVSDDKTFDGVVHNLGIISRAVEHVPLEVRDRAPDAEWSKFGELGDLVLGEGFGVDATLVWELVQAEVPALLEDVRRLLSDTEGPAPERGNVGLLSRVESSMLYAIGYDAGTRTLETVYYSGGIYRYFDVPPDVYEGLLAAQSKGRYMWAHVLEQFPYERVRRRS